jgi:hypothetical protein
LGWKRLKAVLGRDIQSGVYERALGMLRDSCVIRLFSFP